MKSVLIFGVSGMLGHQLYNYLKLKKYKVYGCIKNKDLKKKFENLYYVNVKNFKYVKKIVSKTNPDYVINCSGIVKKNIKSINDLYEVNALFPIKLDLLSQKKKFKLIHISTDCVFSGNKGNYSENDLPDAKDDYGLSKLLGEVYSKNSLTIRTSIIGREIKGNRRGLLEWFLAQKSNKVFGYTKAFFSGVTTLELSKIIYMLLKSNNSSNFNRLLHIAGPKISKYKLLELFRYNYKKNISIYKLNKLKIDRSLNSNKFMKLTNYKKKTWSKMIAELIEENYEDI